MMQLCYKLQDVKQATQIQSKSIAWEIHAAVLGNPQAIAAVGTHLESCYSHREHPQQWKPKEGVMLLLNALCQGAKEARRTLSNMYQFYHYGLQAAENDELYELIYSGTTDAVVARISTDMKLTQPEVVLDAKELAQYDEQALSVLAGVNQRNPIAELEYARYQLNASHGVKRDIAAAVKTLQRLMAEVRDPNMRHCHYGYAAMYELAQCYADGRGVSQSAFIAERLFVTCAESHYGSSFQFDLARRYLEEDGVPRSPVSAFYWFQKLADTNLTPWEVTLTGAEPYRPTRFAHALHAIAWNYQNDDVMKLRRGLDYTTFARSGCNELRERNTTQAERVAKYENRAVKHGYQADAQFDKLLETAKMTNREFDLQRHLQTFDAAMTALAEEDDDDFYDLDAKRVMPVVSTTKGQHPVLAYGSPLQTQTSAGSGGAGVSAAATAAAAPKKMSARPLHHWHANQLLRGTPVGNTVPTAAEEAAAKPDSWFSKMFKL